MMPINDQHACVAQPCFRSCLWLRGGELALALGMKGTFCLQEQTFLMLHIDQKLLMQQI